MDQASWNDQLELQLTFNRKLHSLVKLPCLDSNDNFMMICYSQVLKASITTNDSLEWESSQAQGQILWLENQRPEKQLVKRQLFVICQINPPADLWKEFVSCACLAKLHELLERPLMKQMILSYKMTILETDN